MKIKFKLLALLLFCTILPLAVNVFVSYDSINQRLKSELIAQYKSQADRLNQSFELSIRGMDNNMLSIYQTAELYNFVTESQHAGEEAIAKQRRVENLLKILTHSLNDFSNVYLYRDADHRMFKVNAKFLDVRNEQVPETDNPAWIEETKRHDGNLVVVRNASAESDQPLLFVGRSIPDVIEKMQAGVIGIDLGGTYFQNMLGKDFIVENTEIRDADGTVIYSTLKEPPDAKDQLEIVSETNVYGWTVATFLSKATLQEIAWDAVKPTLLWGAAFLLVGIVLWLMLSRQISVPIYGLVKRMREVGKGDFSLAGWKPKRERRDEIGFLELQFRSMVERIEALIKREYELKMSESVAQMRALQSQINPHFLYNTLTSIYSEALEAGADNVCKMVKSLSAMFRYTTDHQNDIVTLSAEVDHIRNYLAIQKYRFEDRLEFRIDIPNHLETAPMLKLSLQPIVENAFVHGISRSGHGKIAIEAHETDGSVVLTVSDSAGTLDEREADQLTRQVRESGSLGTSVGLANVHKRVQYLFPGSDGIAIKAIHGKTSVSISWRTEAAS
ncbi:sensor histidine kinase [Cohnella phaseoli]|uniref:HAMP domain-containing protein n=1 Tax=Cohnella phaseoli TaxID=456490 RepID=A0A3D9I349_9BACL|nr:sensor histidine kinase [Cohnella phaseoli]RED55586.1 HAMP domain-containing protein [Cohnella phaseoli]